MTSIKTCFGTGTSALVISLLGTGPHFSVIGLAKKPNSEKGETVRITLLAVLVALMAAVLVTAFSAPAAAKVTGACVNCHTMHNSQGGSPMATDTYGIPPYGNLLVDACVGCHSSSKSST